MDTKVSKTPEEEKEHVLNQRLPEDFDKAAPHKQPEAKKPPSGMHKLLPVVIIGLGLVVAAMLGAGISMEAIIWVNAITAWLGLLTHCNIAMNEREI